MYYRYMELSPISPEGRLDPNDLAAQKAAAQMMHQEAVYLLNILLIGSAFLWWLGANLPAGWGALAVIILFSGLVFIVSLIANIRQWDALLIYHLRCPHCRQPLAERVCLYKSPTSVCPHCGENAIPSALLFGGDG